MATSLPASEDNAAALREAAAAALAAARATGDPGIEVPPLLLAGRLDGELDKLARCGDLAERAGDLHHLVACRFAAAAALAETPAGPAGRARAARLLEEGLAAARGSDDPLVMLQPWADYLRAIFALRPRGEAIAAGEALLAEAEKVRAAETRPERRAQLFGVWRELHDWLAGRLIAGGDPAEARAAFRLLEAGRARELRESLAKDAPPRELAQIEAGLGADEALLAFHLDFARDLYGRPGGGGAVFVSTRAGTRVRPFPDRRRADAAVALLLGAVTSRQDTTELERRAGTLFFGELEPVLPAGTRRLILVPAGSLFQLPWALLRDAGGRRLGDRFEIVVAPAASFPRQLLEPRQGGALVFADPAFAAATPPLSPLAAARGELLASPRGELPRLPRAGEEGREVRRRLGGVAWSGEDASEAALRAADLGRYSVLHFAAHAVLDDELPERSALLLAPGGGEDGRLEPREIAALPLSGQLVALAGCRSALGQILRGEGPMSLGRAFLAAGAPAVLGSLWDLRDDEAAAFFGHFYRHLAGGESAAAALRATQTEIAASGAPAAAWAGVVLLGDGGFRVAPRPGRWLPTAGAAALLAALLYLVVRRVRRARSR